ncbi:hypothetical protein LGM65_30955 [Burkholderia anthina]|uniref:hypothetical protein n=1 Tax=Burkholderia anthina TaxID=179879 RepID=UPI001CF435BF|nr:hypothetical protein [Burkholderia anthina]MCA8095243.1 hypothetical protein [Burkholderia anthina]
MKKTGTTLAGELAFRGTNIVENRSDPLAANARRNTGSDARRNSFRHINSHYRSKVEELEFDECSLIDFALSLSMRDAQRSI